MQTEIVIAGFGGQGVLFAGQVLAYAAMDTGWTMLMGKDAQQVADQALVHPLVMGAFPHGGEHPHIPDII